MWWIRYKPHRNNQYESRIFATIFCLLWDFLQDKVSIKVKIHHKEPIDLITKRLKTPYLEEKKTQKVNKNFDLKIRDSYWLFLLWAEQDKNKIKLTILEDFFDHFFLRHLSGFRCSRITEKEVKVWGWNREPLGLGCSPCSIVKPTAHLEFGKGNLLRGIENKTRNWEENFSAIHLF